jgi:5-methyltetrahydrofolate corrinoid/iron sulfur protein methyltransferase
MSNTFISIGESIHASIPKTAKMMKQLEELGDDRYTKDSEPLNYIRNLIEMQADEGANYIAVNLDAFGEDDPKVTADMMVEYARMVRKWGKGVPVCMDSSDDNVLKAGLKEWYNTDDKVPQPLINSVKVYTIDNMLCLKKDYDFAFVGLLMKEGSSTHSIDDLYELAKQIFNEAVNKYGFKSEEIFFDSTIFPLAIDMPMTPGEPGFTYKYFEAVKKIKNDPQMKGVHFTGGITNSSRDFPARKIGVMRAFVRKGMEYGLDSGIVNVRNHLAEGEVSPDLMELVDTYAKMDGAPEKLNDVMMLMGKFCQENRK